MGPKMMKWTKASENNVAGVEYTIHEMMEGFRSNNRYYIFKGMLEVTCDSTREI